MKQRTNLNDLRPQDDGDVPGKGERRTMRVYGNIEMWLDGIENRIVSLVQEADAVVGCVAWLTNEPILRAMQSKPVSFVVQKEDFLRPDLDADADKRARHAKTRHLYTTGPTFERRFFGQCLAANLSLQTSCDPLARVRCVCVGERPARGQTTPKMHHKFGVFCRLHPLYRAALLAPDPGAALDRCAREVRELRFGVLEPFAAVAGSYNWTFNATASLEDTYVFRDPHMAADLVDEWAHVLSLSEPCDWEADWYVKHLHALGVSGSNYGGTT